jgi:hypothetical protein
MQNQENAHSDATAKRLKSLLFKSKDLMLSLKISC